MNTIMLDDDWDIKLNADGDIDIATDDYAIAQSCANAIRLFINEAYYDQQRGIPHFDVELGHSVMGSMAIFKSRIRNACMAVDGVTDCEIILNHDKANRIESGQVSLATENGSQISIEL